VIGLTMLRGLRCRVVFGEGVVFSPSDWLSREVNGTGEAVSQLCRTGASERAKSLGACFAGRKMSDWSVIRSSVEELAVLLSKDHLGLPVVGKLPEDDREHGDAWIPKRRTSMDRIVRYCILL
jgi:hypothetical protein